MSASDVLRWSGCAAVVLAAHGLVALAIAHRPDDVDLEAGAPVVMIELAPMAVAPPTPPPKSCASSAAISIAAPSITVRRTAATR